jgi:hypothetical protein
MAGMEFSGMSPRPPLCAWRSRVDWPTTARAEKMIAVNAIRNFIINLL